MKIQNKNIFFILIIMILLLINFYFKRFQIKGNPDNEISNSVLKKLNSCLRDKKQTLTNHNDLLSKPLFKCDMKNNKIVIMYNYTSQDLLLVEKKYISTDKEFQYKYNSDRKLIFKTSINDADFINTYEYNDLDQIIIIRDKNGRIQTKYKYNSEGQKIKKIILRYDSPYIKKNIFHYKYDPKGRLITKIHYGFYSPYYNNFFKSNFIKNIASFFNIELNKFHKIDKIDTKYKYNSKGLRIEKMDHLGNHYYYKYVGSCYDKKL